MGLEFAWTCPARLEVRACSVFESIAATAHSILKKRRLVAAREKPSLITDQNSAFNNISTTTVAIICSCCRFENRSALINERREE